MAELIDESASLESSTVGIYRTATVVKGGRRFSWAAMVVVGDHHGSVGIGYAKAGGVPAAIEKAQKDAKKNIRKVTLKGGTLPHAIAGKFGASTVKLIPAAPGTGVIAGATVRAVLEMAGVRDCLTKAYGSTNQKNLCKAAMEGLKLLRSKEEVAELRSVEIASSVVEELLEAGQRYAPAIADSKPGKKEAGATDKKPAGEPDAGDRGAASQVSDAAGASAGGQAGVVAATVEQDEAVSGSAGEEASGDEVAAENEPKQESGSGQG